MAFLSRSPAERQVNAIYTSHNGVVYHADEYVRRWVAQRHGLLPDDRTVAAFGVLVEGAIQGGVLFFNKRLRDIEIAVALDHPECGRARLIHEIMSYPFDQLGLSRVSMYIEESNERSLRNAMRFGAVVEGRKVGAARDHGDVIMLALFPDKVFYHKRYPHGTAS